MAAFTLVCGFARIGMVARLWSCRVPGHAIGLINPAQAQRCPMESASPHAESKTYSALSRSFFNSPLNKTLGRDSGVLFCSCVVFKLCYSFGSFWRWCHTRYASLSVPICHILLIANTVCKLETCELWRGGRVAECTGLLNRRTV